MEQQTALDVALDCVRILSGMNGGRRVVLYLSPLMNHGDYWLPTMNIEGDDGFYRFPEGCRMDIARHFGMDYVTAKQLVDEANAQLGVQPDEAAVIVAAIRDRGRSR